MEKRLDYFIKNTGRNMYITYCNNRTYEVCDLLIGALLTYKEKTHGEHTPSVSACSLA